MNAHVLPILTLMLFALNLPAMGDDSKNNPQKIIFDTDIGNDVDDVLALGMIHALQDRNECELLAVTITKDHSKAAAFTDAVNTFYGRGNIPIGVCRSGITPEEGKFNSLVDLREKNDAVFPQDVKPEDAVVLLRQVLSKAEDHSLVIVQVGFSTNLANLLKSSPDEISELSGIELVQKKVSLLSIMAGAFQMPPDAEGKPRIHREYNVSKTYNLLAFCPKNGQPGWFGVVSKLALPSPIPTKVSNTILNTFCITRLSKLITHTTLHHMIDPHGISQAFFMLFDLTGITSSFLHQVLCRLTPMVSLRSSLSRTVAINTYNLQKLRKLE